MGNSIFNRMTRGTARRFRPRLERLEHRLHLAGDLNVFDLDQGPLGSLPPDAPPLPDELVAPPEHQTVLQRNVFVDDGQFQGAVSLLATPSLSSPGEMDLMVTTLGVQDGELVRVSQRIDPLQFDSLPLDSPQFDSPQFDSPQFDSPRFDDHRLDSRDQVRHDPVADVSADAPTAEQIQAPLSVASKSSRPPAAIGGQVVATRYSIKLTSESIDFSALEPTGSELQGSDSLPASGSAEFALPAPITAAPRPAEEGEALQVAEEHPPAKDLQSTRPSTEFAESLFVESMLPNPRCLPQPTAANAAAESDDGADAALALDAATTSPAEGEADTGEREPYKQLACHLVHSVCKTKLIANLQDCAWMDVLVGAPIGRLSMLNGFDVFHELQAETVTEAVAADPTTPETHFMDALHYGVLMIGVGAAGLVVLRSSLPRKRSEASDAVFGSSIHLDETLAPPA